MSINSSGHWEETLLCAELSVRLSPSDGRGSSTSGGAAAVDTATRACRPKRPQLLPLGTTNCQIELSPADADAIDVLAGEQVLVVPLTREGDGVLTLDLKRGGGENATRTRKRGEALAACGGPIAAVCTVDVVAAPVASSGSGGGKRGNKRPMKAGEAGLSQSLLRRLFDEEDEFMADTAAGRGARRSTPSSTSAASSSSSSSSTPNPSPSPSGSKFSFARGGGGDALISPAKQPPTKPSPSGSKFSFAKGGGGDALISPPSTAKTTRMPGTPSAGGTSSGGTQPLRRKVAIIPLYQLSETWPSSQSSQSLVGIASEITLSTQSDTLPRLPNFESTSDASSISSNVRSNERPRPLQDTSPTIQRSGNVLRELVLKSCRGQYIQEGDMLEVPFVGRTIRLRVGSVASSADGRRPSQNTSGVADQSKREYLSGSIISRLKEAVLRMEDGSSALYQICPETKIKFGTAAPSNENDTSIAGRVQQLAISPPTNDVRLGSKKRVAGLDAELREIKSILLPSLSRPEIFFSAGWSMKPPKGVLLFGPPGVGKTRLAAHVGDILARINVDGERDIVVEPVPCAAIQSYASIVGRAERELCRIFDRAEARASRGSSTLLIVDDVHLICPRRGAAGSSGGGAAIASTLLALLDGIGSEANTANKQDAASSISLEHGPGTVMILATTSDPSQLDPALRRPGRLDIETEIPIPDDAARADILEFLLNQMSRPSCDPTNDPIEAPTLSEQELLAMARLAKGFTGADCTLALKEALRSAILRCDCDVVALTPSLESVTPKGKPIQMTLEDISHAIRITKPSTIRAVTVEVPRVPWSAIGGMEHVKMLLREAVELPVTHAHHFESLSVPPPRGVVLFGPPGCSKTLMARALATEGHMNFLAVKGPELLSKWLGESERALASLFRRARQASPCIIFFDEIDSIATKRGGGGNSGERLLSQLLTELDGVSNTGVVGKEGKGGGKSQRVVVVAATNRPDLLDPALTRPGRIDRKIYVGLPDEESRRGILKVGLKGKACGDDIDVQELSREEITGGFSGAELIAICREAALYALEDCGSGAKIGRKHLLRSIESTKRQITPEMLAFYASYQKDAASSS
mmetsp:Transcript_13637/g.39103  ORF Transcript_13637/g.39103 Transcript_13637/m.39103 type:complete len:1100 (+) Transcript_13637:284-3583(+)